MPTAPRFALPALPDTSAGRALLNDIADRWGYRAEISAPASEGPLFIGQVQAHRSALGVDCCFNDQVSLVDNYRVGELGHGVMVWVPLPGDVPCYELDDGTAVPMRAGHATVLSVAQGARLGCRYPRGQRYRSLILQAVPQRMADAALAGRLDDMARNTRLRSFPLSVAAQALLARLLAETQGADGDEVVAQLLWQSCALALLADGLRAAGDAREQGGAALTATDRERLARVGERLRADLGKAHSLSELATEAGMSVSAFKYKFHAAFGQPVFAYLREQRLLRAQRGLRCEGWSVKQAAYVVGYRHPGNFAAAYRRRFGEAPSGTP